MFQIWFQKSTSILFQRNFFYNFSFFDWPFRICLCLFVDRFTSLIEMLLIFTKKRVFESSEADLLSVSIFHDLMLLVVGDKKRAVYKECLVLGMKVIAHELDLSWVMVLKLSKKCIFCSFVLTSARNLSWLKQFTYNWCCFLCYDVLFQWYECLKSKNFWGISAESAFFCCFNR